MKKLMTIGLAAVAVLTLAGQAKATALETSGELRARAWYVNNYVVNKRGTEWWDQRLRLNMVWPVAENVKVNVRADILEGFWGENSVTSTTAVAEDPLTGAHTVTVTSSGVAAKPAVDFDHVNMVFTWPDTPVTFTVGRQDVSWGPGFYTKADNRDRFKFGIKFAPELTIGFAYDKNKEIFAAHESGGGIDDNRGFTLSATGAAAGWSYGALVAYAINETTPATGDGVTKRIPVSAYLMGKAGVVDLKVEATYITGSNKLNNQAQVDVTGLGAYVSVGVPAGPVNVSLEGAYAAGNDPATPENEGGFRADYQSPFWSIILYNNFDHPGYLGSATGNAVTSTGPAGDFGVTNAMAGKMTISMTPVKKFTLILAGVYAQALQDVRITTAAVPAKGNVPAVPARTTTYSGNLGTEFDLVAMLNITDNVYFLGGVGYLMAGDFFGDVENPFGAMLSFNVKF